jgi:hypothetical protein
MDEHELSETAERGLDICGVTVDCGRVQRDLRSLAESLAKPELASSADFRTHCFGAVHEAQRDLCEHMSRIEGSGGLFEYIDEGAPQCAIEVGQLCQQHCDLARCLRQLGEALGACDANDPATIEQVRTCRTCLAQLMCLHRASLGELLTHVATA